MIILRCSHPPKLNCGTGVVACVVLDMEGGVVATSRREERILFYNVQKKRIYSELSTLLSPFLQDKRALSSLQEENITTNTVSIYRFLRYEYLVLIFVQVRTRKIHIFTIIQLLALAFILGIKLSPLAPSFPFFIICLIPLRKLLTKFYDEHEMEEVCLIECSDWSRSYADF